MEFFGIYIDDILRCMIYKFTQDENICTCSQFMVCTSDLYWQVHSRKAWYVLQICVTLT